MANESPYSLAFGRPPSQGLAATPQQMPITLAPQAGTQTVMGMTAGQMTGAAALISAYGASQAQKAQAINQQTAYLVQARDALAMAEVRAEFAEQYATVQAGRLLQRAEIEAQNYQIAGNTLLRNLRKTNAAIRARAAASGVAYGEGSIAQAQLQNVAGTMQDVGIADLNALTARVLGFEDATAMLQSTEYQNAVNMFQARRAAGGLEATAAATRRTGGLLSTATLVEGAQRAAKVR